jgi:hypothetical protein
VSFHWQNPKTEANMQEPTKEPENAKLADIMRVVLKTSVFVGVF